MHRNHSQDTAVAYPADGRASGSYLVEHLASFSASVHASDTLSVHGRTGPGESIMSPDEAMRRLQQLTLRRSVCTTRVTVVVTDAELMVFDTETDSIMERFPLSLIHRPTPMTSEMYDNVVVMVVLGEPQQQLEPEVHIFRCLKHRADQLVGTILAAKAKKKTSISSIQHEVESAVWPEKAIEYEHAAKRTANAMSGYKRDRQQTQNTAISSADRSSDRVVKSVEILNKCFDDIEQFMERLQSVADAYKELENRRRGRKKKAPQHGDGMLSIRARNPPDQDIIEVLQKFKVSFNLLARLKSHIHDPNSPELVHFLFTPLSLIVEASQTPNTSVDLASKVVSPLLTSSAVALLRNCLTSKEMELWSSLGDAWTQSRDQWSGPMPSYQLRFTDGYEPERIYWDEDDVTSNTLQHKPARSVQHYPTAEAVNHGSYSASGHMTTQAPGSYAVNSAEEQFQTARYITRQRDGPPTRPPSQVSSGPPTQRPGGPPTQRPSGPPAKWPGGQPGAWPARGTAQWPVRPAAPPDQYNQQRTLGGPGTMAPPLPVHGGPVMRDYTAQERFLREIQQCPERVYQVIKGHESRNYKELTVMKGDILEVMDGSHNWWRVRNYRSEIGYVPYTLLQPFSASRPPP